MITKEQLEKEQRRRAAKLLKSNKIKIRRVYAVLEQMNMPNLQFQEFLVDMSQPITAHTKLVFVEKSYAGKQIVHTRRYHHFLDRGLVTKSILQYSYLYLAIFRNKTTGEVRIKFGITGKPNNADRFRRYSDTWEFVGWLCKPRRGERKQIELLEKELKSYCRRNNLLCENVRDFTFEGKTELLMAMVDGVHLLNMLNIFNRKTVFETM